MKRCNRCLLPETVETICFDSEGICNICNSVLVQKPSVDWDLRLSKLDLLVSNLKTGKRYDLLIPFSGGKDSTYQLYFMRKRYPHLKILAVTFDHLFFRKAIIDNNTKTFANLGVDRITFSPNWHIVRQLMNRSLRDKGDFCWHCHSGIYSFPLHTAYQYEIPLILWNADGEGNAYFQLKEFPEIDLTLFNRYVNLGISADDMHIRLGGSQKVDRRDLWQYSFPTPDEYPSFKVRSLSLSSYIPWDWKEIYSIIHQDLGWECDDVENLPPQYSYTKIECWMQGVRDYIKYIKRGYSRPSQMVAVDLRDGSLNTQGAQKIIDDWECIEPFALNLLLEYLDMSSDEFYNLCTKHSISPWTFSQDSLRANSLPLHDTPNWQHYPPLSDSEQVSSTAQDRYSELSQ